ncbi:MAG TPA: VanZ family protein [Opitutaceae bacterium]|nr:VanZ family protein [Opitutaceae bacterium]
MTPRQQFVTARLAYVAIVLLATLSDLGFSGDLAAAGGRLARAFTPSLAWRDAVDGLRNVALFAGLGAVWVVTSLTGRVEREVRQATLVGLALSATVEGLQVFSPVRIASIVDVTTNAAGAFAGAAVTAVLIAGAQRSRGARSYLGVPMWLVAGGYVGAVLVEALVPLFDSEPLPMQGGPLATLGSLLHSTAPPLEAARLFDLALFAPAGFLAVLFFAERGTGARKAWGWVAAGGALMVFGAELAHGTIRLTIRWEAAALHAAALAAGAWAAALWLAPLTQALRGAGRARAAIAAYAIVLAVWAWRPFAPQTDLEAIASQFTPGHLIPLAALSGRVDVFSAVHVAQQFLLYLPLGALLAVWPLRLAGRWSHLRPALALAVALEVGHIVIAGRFFDVTNALLACAGLGLGWVAVRRSGFRPYGAALPAPARPSPRPGARR